MTKSKIKLKTGTLVLKEDERLKKLVKYGSRINKKRGFLFVSKVLGKHLPTKPSKMKKTYIDMANEINKKIDRNLDTIVIGFAETATALGNGVYDALKMKNSFYIHSTRYTLDKERFFEFFEEHCHAPSHIFYKPDDKDMLRLIQTAKNVILVDDEVTTGNTANNMVNQLKKVLPNAKNFYLATILNWSKNKYDNFEYISLYQDEFEFKANEKELNKEVKYKSVPDKIENLDNILPKKGSRFGIKKHKIDFSKYIDTRDYLLDEKILVLGTSEFMYIPYLIANYMEGLGYNVKYQATTRSPANVEGALKSRMEFKDNYFENIDNFLYNVKGKKYNKIIICYETNKLPKKYKLKKKLEKLGFNVNEIIYKGEEND